MEHNEEPEDRLRELPMVRLQDIVPGCDGRDIHGLRERETRMRVRLVRFTVGKEDMKNYPCIFVVLAFAVLGCDRSGRTPQSISSGGDVVPGDEGTSRAGIPYPITVSGFSRMPAGTLEVARDILPMIVRLAKGLPPRQDAYSETPASSVSLFLADAKPWIAKVRVLDGPISVFHPGPYLVGGPIVDLPMWLENRFFNVEVLEVWLGKPSRTFYQLWDVGGYCPGDLAWCEGHDKTQDECLRIRGTMRWFTTCEYRHPETGELLVRIGGLDVPSGLVSGEEFILFGADAVSGLSDKGLWTKLDALGADPAVATLTEYERLLFPTCGDQVDVKYLWDESFPGSPGTMDIEHPRWIHQRLLARRILERIVMPYLADHPDDKPYVEAAMSGLLLEEYLFPTPEEPEETAITSCPKNAVAFAGAKCEGTFTCHEGKVTCCGEVYSRENCACNRSFSDTKDVFECVVIDEKTCFGGSCPPKFCMADQECPPGMRCFPVILPFPLDAVGYTCVPVP